MYSVRQWPKLVLHLEHGEVPIHNNATANQSRPFSRRRRVWLFANNPRRPYTINNGILKCA